MGIKTEGFDDLAETLNNLRRRADSYKIAGKALRAGAEVILREMKQKATIDPQKRTGDLHDSLDYSGAKLYGKRKYITVGVHRKDWEKRAHKPTQGENWYYPAYVEYGHGGPAPAAPHPYIRVSFDKMHPDALEAIKRVLREEIR